MPTNKTFRQDLQLAAPIIESLFDNTHARSLVMGLLSDDIRQVASIANDRWGVTLFANGFRLNVGWVECLVVTADDVRLLVEERSVTKYRRQFIFEGRGYRWAPGCALIGIGSDRAADVVPLVTPAHQEALIIASRRPTQPSIQKAHSPAIIDYLRTVMRFDVENPSYVSGMAARRVRYPDQALGEGVYEEGSVIRVLVNRFERDDRAREACVAKHGLNCSVCDVKLAHRYGPLMEGFIHVHHTKPLSSARGKRRVDPVRDLRPICPNCHAFVHQEDPPIPIERARKMMSVLRRERP
jgi:hypothetical protein